MVTSRGKGWGRAVMLLALPLCGCGVDVGASLVGLAISNVAGAGMQAAVKAVSAPDAPKMPAPPAPGAPSTPAAARSPAGPAIFDAAAVPLVSDAARARLAAYPDRPFYKAVAISPSGAWAMADDLRSEAEARRVVVERCNFDDPARRCVLYAVGDGVVYDR